MKYFLAFDVGTTAMKCILYDKKFNEIFYANKEYSLDTREGGIAELDSEIYFDTFLECVNELKQTSINFDEIVTITFTTQGETMIPVDKDGNALMPAVVWLDTRAEKEAEDISRAIDSKEFYETTGLCGVDGALPAAKIAWIRKNRPDVYDKTYKFLLLEDYLIYRLTGKFVSEKSLQSSTGWYDIVNDKLYEKLISVCKIDGEKLPEILPCGTVIGGIKSEIIERTALSENTAVVTGAMDQIASAIGIGNTTEGMFSETTGTALVVGITVTDPVFDLENPITVYRHFDDKFIYMPYYSTAGITLKWFRDNVMPYILKEAEEKNIGSYDIIDQEAAKSPAGSNGLVMLADLSANGAFIGLNLSTKTSDMARSVMEGVAYMLRNIVEFVESRNISIDKIYSLGGGSYSPLWRQIKADVCKKQIVCTDYAQTTALGAAILGAVAVGEYQNVCDALKMRNVNENVNLPNSENFEIYDKSYKKYTYFTKSLEV